MLTDSLFCPSGATHREMASPACPYPVPIGKTNYDIWKTEGAKGTLADPDYEKVYLDFLVYRLTLLQKARRNAEKSCSKEKVEAIVTRCLGPDPVGCLHYFRSTVLLIAFASSGCKSVTQTVSSLSQDDQKNVDKRAVEREMCVDTEEIVNCFSNLLSQATEDIVRLSTKAGLISRIKLK